MKILHIALLSHFTCGMAYQDNVLVEINAADGHDVTIISDTMYYKDGVLTDGEEEDIILPDGVRLIRLKYDRIVNSFITEKIYCAIALAATGVGWQISGGFSHASVACSAQKV